MFILFIWLDIRGHICLDYPLFDLISGNTFVLFILFFCLDIMGQICLVYSLFDLILWDTSILFIHFVWLDVRAPLFSLSYVQLDIKEHIYFVYLFIWHDIREHICLVYPLFNLISGNTSFCLSFIWHSVREHICIAFLQIVVSNLGRCSSWLSAVGVIYSIYYDQKIEIHLHL